ncbi:heterokaryon incompatibility protein-domain-containing protein [Paraphoma chrysanthemicola]|uniref:Heterokaryon incompatibility protein-domain-containing protein n=1 Tax=Paraphoma chrysanthemicola TaxID=798071 RepID=A0A8K0RGG9_9PLEO|nr:heterokaryon incompatibility protein-domain-containing protein [Paraphoma chrysanthemicola]
MPSAKQCSVCENLRPVYVSTKNDHEVREDVLRRRSYGEFRLSSTEGCSICAFVQKAFQHFDPNSGDASSALLRIAHTGAGTISMGNKSSTLQIYTPQGFPPAWPGIIRGDSLSSCAGSEEAFEFVQRCLQTCDMYHPECTSPMAQLPTRLIEVYQDDTSYVRLVETETGRIESYIALSYCWGVGDTVKTTLANYNQMLSAIAVATLPQTLRDSITITRHLQQKYIWIDAICIIQDSTSDWEAESATMAAVYRNAYLTIAAGTAAAATDGFLAHQYPAAEFPDPFQMPWCTEEGVQSVLAARIIPGYEMHCEAAEYIPLESRGWCLQEQLLSTRLLTYREEELYWTCLASSLCECGLRDHMASQQIRTSEDTRIPYLSIFQITKEEAWDKWRYIVDDFSLRSLTHASDRLPAIAGVATVIQNITGSGYFAGLWKDNLLPGMVWESSQLGCTTLSAEPCDSSQYIAPSFSWASSPNVSDYSKALESTLANRHMTWAFKCEVLDSECILRGVHRLGQVESAFIRLKGPILRATLRKEAGVYTPNGDQWIVVWKDVSLPMRADARLEECQALRADGVLENTVCRSPHGSRKDIAQEGATVFVLYLVKMSGSYAGRKTWARMFLVLGRSCAKAGAYVRLGTINQGDYGSPEKLRRRQVGFQNSEITLV